MTEKKICPNCGAKNGPNDILCGSCSEDIMKVTPEEVSDSGLTAQAPPPDQSLPAAGSITFDVVYKVGDQHISTTVTLAEDEEFTIVRLDTEGADQSQFSLVVNTKDPGLSRTRPLTLKNVNGALVKTDNVYDFKTFVYTETVQRKAQPVDLTGADGLKVGRTSFSLKRQ